jgi:hypothetical protein
MPDHLPFFIIGAGRSGTTLLRLILAGHSRLHVTPETWFITDLVSELPLDAVLDLAAVERAVTLITEDYRWPDMEMSTDILRCRARRLQQPRLADIIDLVYSDQLARAGKQRCGDKTPIYIEIVPQLLALYPNARFVHLIRDGRDVSISRIDAGWERYYERSRFTWKETMRWRQQYAKAPFARQILDVKYEDLVTDPEETTRRICGFLGEAFEPTMLNWQSLLELVPKRERRIHGRLTQPISNVALAVWRTRLTAWECFAIESCMYSDLEQLGYGLRYSRRAWRPLLKITGAALRQLAPLLCRGIPYLQRRKLLPARLYI